MAPPLAPVDLTGRVALVTGASRGLGREIAHGLAACGARVVLTSRKIEGCEQVADEIRRATGTRPHARSCHMGDWEQVDALVDDVYRSCGQLDIIVNNAGISPALTPPHTQSRELVDKIMSVNLAGPFRLMAVAGERMVAARTGSIINISSMGSVRPRPPFAAYAGSKAGLNAMSEAFAKALGPTVRVNTLLVGTFLTAMQQDEQRVAKRARHYALRRPAQPWEVVGTVAYLASDASSYVTGATLRVDGGQP